MRTCVKTCNILLYYARVCSCVYSVLLIIYTNITVHGDILYILLCTRACRRLGVCLGVPCSVSASVSVANAPCGVFVGASAGYVPERPMEALYGLYIG